MTITESEHKITLSSNECFSIAYDAFCSLEVAVKTHWINHPLSWLDSEKDRIERMKVFFSLANYSYLFEMHMKSLTDYIEKNKKQ